MPPIRGPSAPGWMPWRAVLTRSGARSWAGRAWRSDAGEIGGVVPLASAAFVRALIGERSRQARLLLAHRLESVVLRERWPGTTVPLVAGAPRDTEDQEAAGSWYDAQAGFLADRWTAAGLDALLRGRAAQLAPGLDRPDRCWVWWGAGRTHLEMFGPGVVPLAPAPPPATAQELAAAVRAAPLPASLAATATDPEHADLAAGYDVASGFLRRGGEGLLLPGTAAEIWADGTPAELAGLALDVLGALLAQMAQDEETARNSPARTCCCCTPSTSMPGSRSPWHGRRQWLRNGSSPRKLRPHPMLPLRTPGLTSCPPSRFCHSSPVSPASPRKTMQNSSPRPPGWLAS